MTELVEASHQNGLLPVTDPLQAEQAYKAYLQLCQAVLIPYDKRIVDSRGVVVQESAYARIPQRRKNEQGQWITEYVDAPKKSAWRKLARFYGVSTEIVDKKREQKESGCITWHYTVRAWQGCVSTMGEASCSTADRNGYTEHDAKATAHTRAKNRAISDLIGFGQVSAEEIEATQDNMQVKPRQAKSETKPRKKPQPEADPDEEAVIETLSVHGLGVHGFTVVKYKDVVRVSPPKGIVDSDWEQYNKVLELRGASWSHEFSTWEVPI